MCRSLGGKWLRFRFSFRFMIYCPRGEIHFEELFIGMVQLSKYINSTDMCIWVQVQVLIIPDALQVCGPAQVRPATMPRPASPMISGTKSTKHRPKTGHHKV